jgi:hypothetical protein
VYLSDQSSDAKDESGTDYDVLDITEGIRQLNDITGLHGIQKFTELFLDEAEPELGFRDADVGLVAHADLVGGVEL